MSDAAPSGYLGRAIFSLCAPLYWPAMALLAYYGFTAPGMGFGAVLMLIWVVPAMVMLGVGWTVAALVFAGTLMKDGRRARTIGLIAMGLNGAVVVCGIAGLLWLRSK